MNKVTRGIRLNNPGNIDYVARNKWDGLADPPIEQDVPNPRFCRFIAPLYGIRAIAVLLLNYQRKYGDDTLEKIINRWAPPVENKTSAYVKGVAKRTGFDPNQLLDLSDFATSRPIVEAIIHHENGTVPYDAKLIDEAVGLALGVHKPKPVSKTKTVRGAATGIAIGGGTVTVGTIAAAAPAVSVLGEISAVVQENPAGVLIVVGVLVMIAAGFVIWARVRDSARRGT